MKVNSNTNNYQNVLNKTDKKQKTDLHQIIKTVP
jgi:hypothetical protein